jgi:hypothetical protein
LQVETPLERASCWFLNSGIQEANGGVARFHQTDLESNAPISTEITGYAISSFVYAYKRTGLSRYLEAAVAAGGFLINRAWDADAATFPFELTTTTGLTGKTYFFDCGIIVRGLLALWRETDDERYLLAATRGGVAMRDFWSGNELHPILQLPGKEPAAHQTAWSRSPGCYQLKAALAWRELSEVTGDSGFGADYERAVAVALKSHRRFLPAPDGPEKTMDRLHAYAYFLEGLLAVGEREAAATVLAEGVEQISRYLRDIEPVFVRSDVYAQLLRIRLLAESLGDLPQYREEATQETKRKTDVQSFEQDEKRRGGFYFGRKNDTLMPYVNPVSTAFCMQALDLWADYTDGKFNADLASLI